MRETERERQRERQRERENRERERENKNENEKCWVSDAFRKKKRDKEKGQVQTAD